MTCVRSNAVGTVEPIGNGAGAGLRPLRRGFDSLPVTPSIKRYMDASAAASKAFSLRRREPIARRISDEFLTDLASASGDTGCPECKTGGFSGGHKLFRSFELIRKMRRTEG